MSTCHTASSGAFATPDGHTLTIMLRRLRQTARQYHLACRPATSLRTPTAPPLATASTSAVCTNRVLFAIPADEAEPDFLLHMCVRGLGLVDSSAGHALLRPLGRPRNPPE